MTPNLVFGGGGLTVAWKAENITELAEALQKATITRIDSAATYPYTAPGGADKLLGDALLSQKDFLIDTKILYKGDGSGTLAADAISRSLSQSLQNLNVEKINVLYCHAPDKKTPIKEQAAAMDAEYRKGRFNQLGVCNFSTEMLEEWLQIANENGFVKPSVFQGQYNLLCRTYESTLFPLLRAHNISFVAYSPLAGGFLTGKVTFSKGPDDLQGTRFEVSETNFGGMRYRSFYDKPSMHAALRQVAPACESHGITLGNAAMRWLLFHSYLDGNRGDSVVIGPNTLPKVDEYVTAKDAGPLPGDLVAGLNSVWENVKEDARPIVEY